MTMWRQIGEGDSEDGDQDWGYTDKLRNTKGC